VRFRVYGGFDLFHVLQHRAWKKKIVRADAAGVCAPACIAEG
jgi:hypothetical protein